MCCIQWELPHHVSTDTSIGYTSRKQDFRVFNCTVYMHALALKSHQHHTTACCTLKFLSFKYCDNCSVQLVYMTQETPARVFDSWIILWPTVTWMCRTAMSVSWHSCGTKLLGIECCKLPMQNLLYLQCLWASTSAILYHFKWLWPCLGVILLLSSQLIIWWVWN